MNRVVKRTPVRLLAVAAAILLLFHSPVASARIPVDNPTLRDPERDCEELVPESYSVGPLLGEMGADRTVSVLVLADGLSRKQARLPMTEASELYSALGVDLAYRVKPVTFAGHAPDAEGRPAGDVTELFTQLRDEVSGVRPEGTDIVHLLTSKRLFVWQDGDGDGEPDESERTYGAAGVAFCIGGVRWDETSFAMSQARTDDPTWTIEEAGITMAHELGHLLGGQHQHANCVDGTAQGPQEGRVRPCTVMFAATYDLGTLHTMSTEWARTEAAVIRGHVEAYTGP